MTRQGSILVVDDSEFNRDALSRRLVQKGFLVEVAADGAGALECVAKGAHDLVLLDVEMPGMSGLEVLSRLRATRSQTELPVIMVTARAQSADIVEALSLGANDYITKPIDFPVALARDPYASVSQMGRRGPARKRRTVRGCRAGRERRAVGLERDDQ